MTEWRCIDAEPQTGGVSGGDNQVGDDVTVRFRLVTEPDDGKYAIIEETWYAEDYSKVSPAGSEPNYGVMCRVGYTICTDPDDPGGTELFSDYEYDDGADVRVYLTEESATEAVMKAAKESVRQGAQYYMLDGRGPVN